MALNVWAVLHVVFLHEAPDADTRMRCFLAFSAFTVARVLALWPEYRRQWLAQSECRTIKHKEADDHE